MVHGMVGMVRMDRGDARARARRTFAVALLCATLAAGCDGGGERGPGLAATPDGPGPRIVWDLYAKPVAELPFPNDVATQVSETSPTGRRLNLSTDAPTRL